MGEKEQILERKREILELLFVSRQNLYLVLLVGLLCGIISAGVTLTMPNVYRAEAKLVVTQPKFKSELSPQPLSVKSCEDLITSPWLLEETRRQIMRMKQVVMKLLESKSLTQEELRAKAGEIVKMPLQEWKQRFNFDTETALKYQALTVDDIVALYEVDVDKLRKIPIEEIRHRVETRVNVERKTNILVEYSPILNVRVRMNTPRLARLFVNTLINVFVDLYADVTSGQTKASATLVEEKYQETRANLEQTEDAITAFKKQYKVDLMAEKIKVLETALSDMNTELKKMEADYALGMKELENIQEHLAALSGKDSAWIGYFYSTNPLSTETVTESALTFNAKNISELSPQQVRQSLQRIKEDYLTTDKEWVDFSNQYRIDTTNQQLNALRSMFNEYQQKLYEAELNIQGLEKSVAELKKQLAAESKTLALQKGITDDALWQLIISKPSSQDVVNLGKITVRTEEVNPTYVEIANQLFQQQTELERNRAYAERLRALLNEINQELQKLEDTYARGYNRQDQLIINKTVVQEAYKRMSDFYVKLEEDEKKKALEMAKLKVQIDELNQVIKQTEDEVKALKDLYQEKKTEQDRLERDLETYKAFYKTLNENREQARIALINKPLDVRIATTAVTPNKKIAPQRTVIVLTTTAIGLAAAFIVVYLVHTIKILKQSRRLRATT